MLVETDWYNRGEPDVVLVKEVRSTPYTKSGTSLVIQGLPEMELVLGKTSIALVDSLQCRHTGRMYFDDDIPF